MFYICLTFAPSLKTSGEYIIFNARGLPLKVDFSLFYNKSLALFLELLNIVNFIYTLNMIF